MKNLQIQGKLLLDFVFTLSNTVKWRKNMDILTAKQQVIDAGLRLVETGLIARTWGNVSCRIDKNSFVITPSGKAYEDLTPKDIVLVSIEDCKYEGNVKPSSEKGIHAACYALRPDCNFVIHTHQKNASAVSTLGFEIQDLKGRSKELIGDYIPLADYGMPSTGKLKKGVVKAIVSSDSRAIIMSHHGAVCLGADNEDAFNIAAELETVCLRFIMRKYKKASDLAFDGFKSIAEYVNERTKVRNYADEFSHFNSVRKDKSFVMTPHDGGEKLTVDLFNRGGISEDTNTSIDLHRAVYNARKDVNAIVHSDNETIKEFSKTSRTLRPLLDDFAQLVGVSCKTAVYDANQNKTRKVVRALRCKNAALLRNNGAICVAGDEYDAKAVEMVLEKNINTKLTHTFFGQPGGNISLLDSAIMRLVYKLKYSKQK